MIVLTKNCHGFQMGGLEFSEIPLENLENSVNITSGIELDQYML